ncbi:MAG: hypothetical protein M3N18_08140 [Actinomycetota bacterium]|nr:hypothetical protein [Actinomycetota bacterium]
MRAILCGCGQRLEAANDDGLVHETLEHYRWVHGMAVVDGEDIRRIVKEGAYGSEQYPALHGDGPDEELWPQDLLGRSGALTHTYEGYGGDGLWPADFGDSR